MKRLKRYELLAKKLKEEIGKRKGKEHKHVKQLLEDYLKHADVYV